MYTARFQYRCRRCGEIEDGTFTRWKRALCVLVNSVTETKTDFDSSVDLINIHNCKDGSLGVSDLIGAEKVITNNENTL